IERGMPRFEGSVQFARAVGRAAAGAQSLIVEPWRVTSRIKGDSAAAVFGQNQFQNGPGEKANKLGGGANLALRRKPKSSAALSSAQIDLDRVLALPEGRQRPLAAVKTLAESVIAAARLPIPAALSINAENVTLGGATLMRVGAELSADADGLDIKSLDLR